MTGSAKCRFWVSERPWKKFKSNFLSLSAKFLKNVGITSQRKIEDKVRENVETSKITTSKKIKISAQLFSEDLNLDEKIEGERLI